MVKGMTWKHVLAMVTGAITGAVMMVSQAASHHQFTDTNVVPDPYFTVVSSGMLCPTIDEVIVEVENLDTPTGVLTDCIKVQDKYAPFPTMIKPLDWFTVGDYKILISEVSREGQTGYTYVDYLELDQTL